MTPIKDIPGFNRDIQGLENDTKVRRARSEKSHQDQELKKGEILSKPFDRKDRVEISSKGQDSISQKESIARYVREIKQLPVSDTQDIGKIQQRIESGFYSKPEVLNNIAESLITSFKSTSAVKDNTAGKKSSSDKRLDRIREKIQSGDYSSDKVLNTIMDELLKIV